MKNFNLHEIIRKFVYEQTKPLTVPVIIKSTYGTLKQQRAQERIGAVFGFRVKAIAKKQNGVTPTEQQIFQAISKKVASTPELQKYLNGEYILIQSDDQRTSDRSYLYNFLVFPRLYFTKLEDSLDALNIDSGDVFSGNGIASKISNAQVLTLGVLSQPRFKQSVDKDKWQTFSTWYDTVKQVNKRVSSIEMPKYEELPDKPGNQKVTGFEFPYQDANKIEHVFTFNGVIDTDSQFIEGEVLDNNKILFNGTFINNEPNTGEVFNTSLFSKYMPSRYKNWIYTGKLNNGKYSEGEITITEPGTDGIVRIKGTWNSKGELFNATTYDKDNNIISRFIDGIELIRDVNVGIKSVKEAIIFLQEDIISMYQNNLDYVNSLSDNYKSSILQFIQKQPNGLWDDNMKFVVLITNIGLMGSLAIDPATKKPHPGAENIINSDVRKQIVQYQKDKIK